MASNWRELYAAALFETDKRIFPERIAEAEKELIRRARELFPAPNGNFDEQLAIDSALRILRMLRDGLTVAVMSFPISWLTESSSAV